MYTQDTIDRVETEASADLAKARIVGSLTKMLVNFRWLRREGDEWVLSGWYPDVDLLNAGFRCVSFSDIPEDLVSLMALPNHEELMRKALEGHKQWMNQPGKAADRRILGRLDITRQLVELPVPQRFAIEVQEGAYLFWLHDDGDFVIAIKHEHHGETAEGSPDQTLQFGLCCAGRFHAVISLLSPMVQICFDAVCPNEVRDAFSPAEPMLGAEYTRRYDSDSFPTRRRFRGKARIGGRGYWSLETTATVVSEARKEPSGLTTIVVWANQEHSTSL